MGKSLLQGHMPGTKSRLAWQEAALSTVVLYFSKCKHQELPWRGGSTFRSVVIREQGIENFAAQTWCSQDLTDLQ